MRALLLSALVSLSFLACATPASSPPAAAAAVVVPFDVSGAVEVAQGDARCPPVAMVRRGHGFPQARPVLPVALSCDDASVTVSLRAGELAHVVGGGAREDGSVVVVVDDPCAICGGASITHARAQQCRQGSHDGALRLPRPSRLVLVTPVECPPMLP
jgi:hypothetical protein